MPIPVAAGYESSVLTSFAAMLAASAAFQALVGVAGNATPSAAARRMIVADDGGQEDARADVDGEPLDLSGSWAVVRLNEIESDQIAMNTWRRSGTVAIMLIVRRADGDRTADLLRRARNAQGQVRADIEAQAGTTTTPGRITGNSAEIILTDATAAPELRHAVMAPITFTWSDVP